MRITHKLILGIILHAALIWGVGVYATRTSQESLRNAIEQASATRATAVMDEIDRTIHARAAEWLAYTYSPLVQRVLQASNEAFENMPDPQGFIDRHDKTWRNAEGQPANQFMEGLLANELAHDMCVRLNELANENGYAVFGEAFITNRYGANAAQTNRTSDYRQDDEYWWRTAVRDRLYIGDVGFDDSSGVFSTDICVRVDDHDGNLLGVLKAVFNIQEVISILDTRSEGPWSESNKRLVLFTKNKQIIHVGNETVSPLRDGSAYFDGIELQAGHDVVTTQRIDQKAGDELLSTYAPSHGYSGFKGLGWVLLVENHAESVLEPVRRLRDHIMLIAMLATLVTLVMGGLLAVSLSSRIGRLASATERFGQGELDAAVQLEGRDELAQLAACFNRMARDRKQAEDERQNIHDELVKASRMAGMAEVATGVLHNVGNVLNSVNLSANQIAKTVRKSQSRHLASVTELIQQHTEDLAQFITKDEKGKLLPAVLGEISELLAQEQAQLAKEVLLLTDHVEHIKTIVSMQQGLTKSSGVMEKVSLSAMVKDAVHVSLKGLSRHGIRLVEQYEAQADQVILDKHKVLQILINLIRNAKDAMKGCHDGERVLSLRVHRCDPLRIQVQVTDTGSGIDPENQAKIFTHGFTTKQDGHGFGLHASALAAKELGGSLTAHSDGAGEGATFTLELPYTQMETVQT